MLSSIGDNADTILTFLTTIATLVTAAGWLFERVSSRSRKRLNYRVHWNESLTRPEGEPFADDLVLSHKGDVVKDPQVAVIRVENTGGTLTRDDFDQPLVFGFGKRQVIHAVVGETEGAKLKNAFGELGKEPVSTSELRLPAVEMRHGDRFKLTVLLTGVRDEVTGAWDHRDGGRLIEEERRVRRSRRGLALGGATLALLGLLLGLIIVPSDSEPRRVAISCHAGTVSISGSTALKPAIETLAGEFKKRCREASPDAEPQILVSESGSRTALDRLVKLGTAATNQEIQRTWLVMYDGTAADPGRVLARHTLGIGIFGVVAHRGAVPDGGLSREEVQRLWDGRASTYDVVGGTADLEVKLVSRQAGSGTRATFEQTVLGKRPAAAPETSSDCNGLDPKPKSDVVHCTLRTTDDVLRVVDSLDGAIGYADVRTAAKYPDVEVLRLDGYGPSEEDVASEAYPFWAVENLYTFGEPPAGTALKDFLAFLATDEAREILTEKFGYLPCSHFSRSEPARACASK
ncbi:PstS family phosphate ABC transporter substrate-binding protein [Cryptosporangium aurantiacum]|uniref:ABC-type phosphate transport system, substrate-binding protein n=1 Tax=Cryptosporangium aurantiacum TaxID=134849 RepID=A0A1M7TWQ5_9ACTN|nr:substrate-binding domain-containing protein [Cryptosporangium aurantiacum]SHN75161.1 ABC-type phosphate transport system, substrate-binding protein [Cryptosporangium aurantiacum]